MNVFADLFLDLAGSRSGKGAYAIEQPLRVVLLAELGIDIDFEAIDLVLAAFDQQIPTYTTVDALGVDVDTAEPAIETTVECHAISAQLAVCMGCAVEFVYRDF
ncbi:hypothetical protein D3C81_1780930 [compost metagenome]